MNDHFPTRRCPPCPSDAELEDERDAQHARDVAEWFATQDWLDTIRDEPAATFRWNNHPPAQEPPC